MWIKFANLCRKSAEELCKQNPVMMTSEQAATGIMAIIPSAT